MSSDNNTSSGNGKESEADVLTQKIIDVSLQEKEEKEARIIETKKEVENRYYGIKKPLIEELKKVLIKEGFGNKTVIEICRRLRGYVTEPYIRKIVDDPELKDESKVRTKPMIELTNDGQTITTNEGEDDNEEEDDKYYENIKLKNNTIDTPLSISDNIRMTANEILPNQHAHDEKDQTIKELKQRIDVMEQEKIQHTTVRLNKTLFVQTSNLVNDKGVKQVLLDFNEHMEVIAVRAIL